MQSFRQSVERNYRVIRAFWALKASYVPVCYTKKNAQIAHHSGSL